jgi:hypothetical protein
LGVQASDLAGNAGAARVDFTLHVSASSSLKPVINTVDQGSGLSQVMYWTSPSPSPAVVDAYSRSGQFTIEGTATKGDAISLWDNNHGVLLGGGSITADANGHWSYAVSGLGYGPHSFQTMETDAGGNQGISNTYTVLVDGTAPTVAITNVAAAVTKSGTVLTLTGSYGDALTAARAVSVTIDNSVTANATLTNSSVNGAWSYTASGLSNAIHFFTAQGTDLAGNVSASANPAVYGTAGSDTFNFGNGTLPINAAVTGGGSGDVFSFSGNFGIDKVMDFSPSEDTLRFAASQFNGLAAVLSHAQQAGNDLVITLDAHDSVTLLNTKLSALSTTNVVFV